MTSEALSQKGWNSFCTSEHSVPFILAQEKTFMSNFIVESFWQFCIPVSSPTENATHGASPHTTGMNLVVYCYLSWTSYHILKNHSPADTFHIEMKNNKNRYCIKVEQWNFSTITTKQQNLSSLLKKKWSFYFPFKKENQYLGPLYMKPTLLKSN